MFSDLKIVTGSSNSDLAKAICDHLGCQLTPTLATTFSDGELRIEIGDNVRGDDVFVVQPTCPPAVNRNLVQLCLMLDALKRASAGRITAVIPYYAYARQDRKVSPRAPISAKMVADFISVAGAERVVTIDLHAGQIQGFFDCPVDNLFAVPVMLDSLRQLNEDKIVIVSPDAGGVERARAYAKRLNAPLAIVDKRRDRPNQAQAMHVIGEVEGRVAIVVDDMIDTAGTLCAGAEVLLKYGATKIVACATHPVLSGPAIDRINETEALSQVIVTDTIPLGDKLERCPKLKIICKHGAGLDNIHLDKARELGIAVCNVPSTNSNAVADLAFGLILAVARNIVSTNRWVREGKWQTAIGVDVCGKTLGLMGFGAIARNVARRASGFGMKVLAYDPYVKELPEEFRSYVALCAKEEVITGCDFLSLHLPLTDETRGMISAPQLTSMRQGAYVINTARGGIVSEKDLYDALISGHIAGAAMDVSEVEPMPADNPLLTLDNVIVTPHIGMYSREAIGAVSLICAQNAAACAEGKPVLFWSTGLFPC